MTIVGTIWVGTFDRRRSGERISPSFAIDVIVFRASPLRTFACMIPISTEISDTPLPVRRNILAHASDMY